MTNRMHPAAVVWMLLALGPAPAAAQNLPHARLFPPEDLGLLEAPDRAIWQKPDEIMDALNIADGSTVADVGAGAGWFTVRLARRVGPNGRVYAEDIQRPMLEAINYRVSREGLTNVRTVLGTPEDPKLPDGLDAVLIVDVYAEVANPVSLLSDVARVLEPQGRVGIVSLLSDVARVLEPQGRVGIVDFTKEGHGPGPPMDERIDASAVVRDARAAGLELLSHETFLPYQFLLVFGLGPRLAVLAGESER